MTEERFPPVETEGGESVRQVGLRVLGERFGEIVARAKRRELTTVERAEASQLERVIETLQAMAPVRELLPARIRRAGQKNGGNAWEAEGPDMVNQGPALQLTSGSGW